MKHKLNLKRELGVVEVFSIASGAMISSGLFVLPALIYAKAGPWIILAYLIGALLMLPAMLAKIELSTAMPKSGGDYFFISRSLGPLLGTFSGMASWFSLALKSAFALLGIGLFLAPILPWLSETWGIKIIALAVLAVFTLLNIISVKESGKLQVWFLFSLLIILIVYIFFNLRFVNLNYILSDKSYNWLDVMKTVGMIFVSYGGLTKIAAIAEEVKEPGRTIPRGMIASLVVVSLIYVLAVFTTVGLLAPHQFEPTTPPISLGASIHMGGFGYIILSVAAMLAFVTTGNAGILASSRAPLAMARDNLIPGFFAHLSIKFQTPVVSVIITALFMALSILFLELENLVKVASTMMLILFSMNNIAVILMRESKIISYKPEFKAPLYPHLYIIGTLVYIALIIQLGFIPLALTTGFFLLSLAWYLLYSKSRSQKDSALIQIVERITSKEIKSTNLTEELRDILMERDSIVEDRFDKIIKAAEIIDIEGEIHLPELFSIISRSFAEKFSMDARSIEDLLKEREKISSTVIATGLAIPHIVVEGKNDFDILVIRSKTGIRFSEEVPQVNVIFALAGSQDERNFHLQALMAIAQIVQNQDFQHKWMKTRTTEDLRHLILLAQRIRKAEI